MPKNLFILFIFLILFLAKKESIVKEYKTGDYFGELALINNDLRAANVIAKVLLFLILYFYFFLDKL